MSWKQLITTNYDQVLERAWIKENEKNPRTVFENNFPPTSWDEFRIWKIHGDKENWKDIILSKESYKVFDAKYKYLQAFLETGFQQGPIVFMGYSMKDSRLYTILKNIEKNGKRENVKGGVYIIHENGYNLLTEEELQILDRFSLEPLITDFGQITEILRSLPAKKLAKRFDNYFFLPYSKLLKDYYQEPGNYLEEIRATRNRLPFHHLRFQRFQPCGVSIIMWRCIY